MRFIFSQDLQKESESKLWPIVLLSLVVTVFWTEAAHAVLLAFSRAALSFSIWSLFFQVLLYGSRHPFKPACGKLYPFLTLFTLCTFVVTKK